MYIYIDQNSIICYIVLIWYNIISYYTVHIIHYIYNYIYIYHIIQGVLRHVQDPCRDPGSNSSHSASPWKSPSTRAAWWPWWSEPLATDGTWYPKKWKNMKIIELDDGKIYRKPLYLMVKTMVSCRFSLKPIHWEKNKATKFGSIWGW
jgi:hypothetical protein